MTENTRQRAALLFCFVGVILFATVLTIVTRTERAQMEPGAVATSGAVHQPPPIPMPDGSGTSVASPGDVVRFAVATNPLIQRIDHLFPLLGGRELLGHRVQVELDLRQHPSMTPESRFWSTQGADQILVVLSRDRRDDEERLEGEPAPHAIASLEPGTKYLVTGTIERLPREEQMFNWRLSRQEIELLANRPVYVRAESAEPVS